MLGARRHSEAEGFGLCDYLQEPRQCGEVTEDGEPNAIPVELGVGSALPASRCGVPLADAAGVRRQFAARPVLAQVLRDPAVGSARAVAAACCLR
jgi:hypothetical protein